MVEGVPESLVESVRKVEAFAECLSVSGLLVLDAHAIIENSWEVVDACSMEKQLLI